MALGNGGRGSEARRRHHRRIGLSSSHSSQECPLTCNRSSSTPSQSLLSGVSDTFVVSGIRVLGDFKQLDRTLQRAIVPSSSIRSRLAAAELPIDYKRDVICLAEAIKKSRNLCKNPAGIFTMVWKIPVSSIGFIDTKLFLHLPGNHIYC